MRILLAITGASGLAYGLRAYEILRQRKDAELFVVVSEGAKTVARYEKQTLPQGKDIYSEKQMDAPFASGSYPLDAMLIMPCSAKTMAAVAHGYADSLISRAAEVQLKERRKLILVPRETPLSLPQIENMRLITLAGGIILPASPAFYHRPKKLEDMVDFIVGKALDQLGLEHSLYRRWRQ